MRRGIVITRDDLARLREHLLGNPRQHEELAYLLAGVNETTHRLQLLVKEIVAVPPEAFERQSGAYLAVKRGFSEDIYWRCSTSGLSLIEAHSHSFCTDSASFSRTDTDTEAKKFPYVERKIPQIYNATMVFGKNSCQGAEFYL